MTSYPTVDEYIGSFPQDVSTRLEEVRRTIRAVAPTTAETISYQMPTVMLDGRYLVYFAAWKHHIGLYPIPPLSAALEAEVEPYRGTRSTVRFPLREPTPYDLIGRVVAEVASQRAAPS
ncbi:iron chaperone [Pengzhenrongella phosphoraccumulans]|uniref:iron chaperone n=1 Tax=Pengzhenrongella phosphoraccumulans TaxID=3114394 RepID=UPI0038908A39